MDRVIPFTSWFFIGVDIGQAQDYTAIAILERVEVLGDWDPVGYAYKQEHRLRLRYLERLPLGTPYPEMAARIAAITRDPGLAGRSYMIADATGVGRPVIDLLRRSNLACNLLPLVITGGETGNHEKGYYREPKRDLIVRLQLLFERNLLQIAAGMPLAPVLAEELANMRRRRTPSGRDQYGVNRESGHDDLVLALALAAWWVYRVYPN